jgi:type IV pilus assembly protein PilP
MRATLRTFVLMAAATTLAASGWAQGAPAAAPPAAAPGAATAPASPAAPGTSPAPAAEPYSYNPEGRRDPFVSLLSRGMESSAGAKASGLSGIATADLVLRGVLQSRGAYVAIVRTPDGRTFRAHANDRLLDGVIRSVTAQGMVIMQEVNDPLSLVKQREVRKGLRTVEDGK